MNKGIAKAIRDYCVFINSGDIFYDRNGVANVLRYLDGTTRINRDTSCSSGRYDVGADNLSLVFYELYDCSSVNIKRAY